MASCSSLRKDTGGFCSADVGGLRDIGDASVLEGCATKTSDWDATFAPNDSAIGSFDFCGAIIPSFSSDSSSSGCGELPFPSATKPAVVTDTAGSGRADRKTTSEEGKWPDFELFANEAELRLGEQVSDLLVCPEIEDILETHPSSKLAASARAHISKV